MATREPTPDPYECPRYLATVADVPRLFAEAFPEVELVRFRAFRPELEGHWRKPLHKIIYSGSADHLLRSGLVRPYMFPVGRKRLRHCHANPDYEAGDPTWKVTRPGKGRVVVNLCGLKEQLLTLAPFAEDRWQFFASPQAAREYCQDQLTFAEGLIDAATSPDGALFNGCEGYLSQLGFAYHPDDRAAMSALTSGFRDQLIQLVRTARIRPTRTPYLRVVA